MRALGLRSTLGRDQTCVTDCVRPVCVSALLCRLHSKRQFGLNACGVCDRDEPQRPHSTLHTPHTVASALAQRASAYSMGMWSCAWRRQRRTLLSTSRNPRLRTADTESAGEHVCAVLREWRERDTNNSQHTRREVQVRSVRV